MIQISSQHLAPDGQSRTFWAPSLFEGDWKALQLSSLAGEHILTAFVKSQENRMWIISNLLILIQITHMSFTEMIDFSFELRHSYRSLGAVEHLLTMQRSGCS